MMSRAPFWIAYVAVVIAVTTAGVVTSKSQQPPSDAPTVDNCPIEFVIETGSPEPTAVIDVIRAEIAMQIAAGRCVTAIIAVLASAVGGLIGTAAAYRMYKPCSVNGNAPLP